MIARCFGRRLTTVTLVVTGVLSITMMGGCPLFPTPQTPSQPTDDQTDVDDGDQAGQPTPPVDTGDRPVITPTPDDGDDDDGDGDNGDDGDGDTGGDGDGGTGDGDGDGDTGGAVFVRISDPAESAVIRPGSSISMEYFVNVDGIATIANADIVVAKDADEDGVADGDPVVVDDAVTAVEGANSYELDSQRIDDAGLLSNGLGSFVVGVMISSSTGQSATAYGIGTITIDDTAPSVTVTSFVSGYSGGTLDREDDLLTRSGQWTVELQTSDNTPHRLSIELRDVDSQIPLAEFVSNETLPAGTATRSFTQALNAFPVGKFNYFYTVTDGLGETSGYAMNPTTGQPMIIELTDRLVGDCDLNRLDPEHSSYDNTATKSRGAIMQGFNFNDLAGNAMQKVSDLNGDGLDEFLVTARFGKPYNVSNDGVGFGEAYMWYGTADRLRDIYALNAAAQQGGLVLPGIRCPKQESWTHGMSDITAIPDMDGDGLPELVFSFPRVESVSLRNSVTGIQSKDRGGLGGLGALEYDAYDYVSGSWVPNTAQFTRGGIVIVSSHSPMLANPARVNRTGDRLVDLHEVGQVFTTMGYSLYNLYVAGVEEADGIQIIDCDPNDPNAGDTEFQYWTAYWDVILEDQGPVGFENLWTSAEFAVANPSFDPNDPFSEPYLPDPNQPPLSPYRTLPYTVGSLNDIWAPIDPNDPDALALICDNQCALRNAWAVWSCLDVPSSRQFACGNLAWHGSLRGNVGEAPVESLNAIWTGFYGPATGPGSGGDELGARILGETREDQFGTAVSADGTWLYVSAPERTHEIESGGTRAKCGVVYQIRTDARPGNSQYTETQLWIEPGQTFPYVDAEEPDRWDYTMPVPHQYIITKVGSRRGADVHTHANGGSFGDPGDEPATPWIQTYEFDSDVEGFCEGFEYSATGGLPLNVLWDSSLYPAQGPGTASYYMSDPIKIVGPHTNAKLRFVRWVGDINNDGIEDFAVGSEEIRETFASDPNNPTGDIVGGVFIFFGREPGLEGEFLLDRIALDPSDDDRLRGVFLRGSASDEKLARTFDRVGDFNGDGMDDVVVGSEGTNSDAGQAVVILGSPSLESPAGGWTVANIVAAGRAISFNGVNAGDLAGANVAGAGDVDGDGIADILVAAPGAESGKGVVYLIYGSADYVGKTLDLAKIGTVELPGTRFIGRTAGDQLGGGKISFPADRPGVELNPNGVPVTAFADGVMAIGDIDGDGYDDYAIGSMLADINGRIDSGEVYILYGKGNVK